MAFAQGQDALGWDLVALQIIGDPPVDVETAARWRCPKCVRRANAELNAFRSRLN
jgi:hypothetical protein